MKLSDNISEIYVMGGRQKADADAKEEWYRYREGLIVRIDASGKSEVCFQYESPPEARPEHEFSCLFKAGTVTPSEMLVCTQTEVLQLDLQFAVQRYVSLPQFNDVHHVVRRKSGSLVAANTGLDSVIEFTDSGEVLNEWSALHEDPWKRFSKDTDYRKVPTTKPHQSHPNYVFELNDELWVTRFEQRDAVSLSNPDARINIAIERPHDGIVHEDRVYFTTVDGHVVVAKASPDRSPEIFNLNEIFATKLPLGWCRGLAVLDRDQVIVGFSRLRATKFRENIRWAKYQLGLSRPKLLPTRIARIDLKQRRVLWTVELEDAGLAAVFSIHPITR
ncbi:MAG: hypothetical protein KDD69_00060 [Bdellovibrionales bacterium]|nr:hypothetical protein [Bdellovibrionales bacterium]